VSKTVETRVAELEARDGPETFVVLYSDRHEPEELEELKAAAVDEYGADVVVLVVRYG